MSPDRLRTPDPYLLRLHQQAEGLADSLFGQGKVTEAKNVMRQAGLVKKGMKGSVPTSYLRWLNKRVANYLDKKNDLVMTSNQ